MPSTFVLNTFCQPAAGNSSSGAPQVAPALLTRMSSDGKRSRDGGGERLRALRRRDVAGDRVAVAQRRQLLAGRLDVVDLARRDDHTRARAHEAVRDHQADAARAAGHEGGLAGDVEQVAHG